MHGTPAGTQQPLVSIILPTYNGERYLAQSIESCLRQTYQNLELIIVNDASTDRSEELVLSYDDPRIVYTRHTQNRGLPRSLNVGFSLARGDYLTWTSDDNYYADAALEVMVATLERLKPRVQFVYCDYVEVNSGGEVRLERHVGPPRELYWRNIIGACFCYSRQVFESVGLYNASVPLAEDYEYWLRVRNRFRMMRLQESLYYYRIHDRSLSAQRASEIQAAAERARRVVAASAPLTNLYHAITDTTAQVLHRAWVRSEEALRPRRRLKALASRLRRSESQ